MVKFLLSLSGIIIGALSAIAYSVLSWGYVCFIFWEWFVVPVFTTLPIITYYQSVGLIVFTTVLKNLDINENEKDTKYVVGAIIAPWLIFMIGGFVKFIIMR